VLTQSSGSTSLEERLRKAKSSDVAQLIPDYSLHIGFMQKVFSINH